MDGWKVLLLLMLTITIKIVNRVLITFYQKYDKCRHYFHYTETKGIRKDFQYFRSTWRPCFSLISYSEKIKIYFVKKKIFLKKKDAVLRQV